MQAQFVEMLEEAVCHAGTDAAQCGFCGKMHGEPLKEGEAPDQSVSIGELGGMLYVYGCRCEQFQRYARFLYQHRRIVLEAYRKLAAAMKEATSEIEAVAGQNSGEVRQSADKCAPPPPTPEPSEGELSERQP